MSKEEALALDGIVSDVLPSAMFRVSLDNGHSVIATLAGKMRRFRIRVLNGDRVTVGGRRKGPCRQRSEMSIRRRWNGCR